MEGLMYAVMIALGIAFTLYMLKLIITALNLSIKNNQGDKPQDQHTDRTRRN